MQVLVAFAQEANFVPSSLIYRRNDRLRAKLEQASHGETDTLLRARHAPLVDESLLRASHESVVDDNLLRAAGAGPEETDKLLRATGPAEDAVPPR